MNNFKFRIWDNINKEMNYSGFILDQGSVLAKMRTPSNLKNICPGDLFSFEKIENQQDYIVLPYLGDIDKKGHEIYEGDILKISLKPRECSLAFKQEIQPLIIYAQIKNFNFDYTGVEKNNPTILSALFAEHLFIRMSSKFNGKLFNNKLQDFTELTTSYEFEIIGNIYQNPELLKQEEK